VNQRRQQEERKKQHETGGEADIAGTTQREL
jgi:hypothetical protein